MAFSNPFVSEDYAITKEDILIIKELAVGPLMANCFICGCSKTKEAVVIDPGGDADRILLALADDKLKVKYIINTHGHFDHVSANGKMKDATSADILIHPLDAPMLGSLSSNAAFLVFQWKTRRPVIKPWKKAIPFLLVTLT